MHATAAALHVTSLVELSFSQAILANLAVRSTGEKPCPYTYIADVLVAVNPYEDLPHLSMEAYEGVQNIHSMPPHPFAVAEQSLQLASARHGDMAHQPQSIIVSGESGAGKTETFKLLLGHLMARQQSIPHGSAGTGYNEALQAMNPALEVRETFINGPRSQSYPCKAFNRIFQGLTHPAAAASPSPLL